MSLLQSETVHPTIVSAFIDEPPHICRDGEPPTPQLSPRLEWQCRGSIRPMMRIVQAAYRAIMEHLTWRGREEGGLMIGSKDSDIVTTFIGDDHAHRTGATFTVDSAGLNDRLSEYLRLGYDAKGFVHSHPPGCVVPSIPDRVYVAETLAKPKNVNCHTYLLPIVCDGQFWPYVITRDDLQVVQRAELVIL